MPNAQISAERIGIGLEELARAAIITQVNALLLLRQPRVDLFGADQELSAKLRSEQEAFARVAGYYLSRLHPNIVQRVSDADAARNLFVSAAGVLQQRLVGPRGDVSQDPGTGGADVVNALKTQMSAYRNGAKELCRLVASDLAEVELHNKSVSDLVQARIRQLDGADGALAATQAAITKAEADRAKHLDEMVSKARNVGDALKKLATGFFEIFVPKSDEKPKTPSSTPKPTDSEPKPSGSSTPKPTDSDPKPSGSAPKPSTATKPETGGDGKKDTSFAVEAITAGQGGMEGHIAAERALIEDNKKIALLYQQLAEQGQSLAIAKAIGSQIGTYASALRAMSASCDAYVKTWDDVVTGLDAFKAEVTRVAASAAEAKTLRDGLVNDVLPTWKRLEDHTRPIRDAFTGADPNAIAAIGPLPT